MGQAKKRGTFEERKANPLGDSPKWKYWTEERRENFEKRILEKMKGQLDSIKKSMFTPINNKTKRFRRIKTGE